MSDRRENQMRKNFYSNFRAISNPPVRSIRLLGGIVISEARILERLGQSHEHILEQDPCGNPRAEVGVPEVASLPPNDQAQRPAGQKGI